jgi:hypothetical protein
MDDRQRKVCPEGDRENAVFCRREPPSEQDISDEVAGGKKALIRDQPELPVNFVPRR